MENLLTSFLNRNYVRSLILTVSNVHCRKFISLTLFVFVITQIFPQSTALKFFKMLKSICEIKAIRSISVILAVRSYQAFFILIKNKTVDLYFFCMQNF